MAALIVVALSWSWRRVAVDPLTGTATADERDRGSGPAEEAALEHGLRLAERCGGRVLAVSVGPPGAAGPLRAALAAGADEALRVHRAEAAAPRPRPDGGAATAAALAAAIRDR
ncbi:hypothetical protein AB8O55_22530, partial [Saccharopolyspora cebuensis]